jgi:Protein of unknown function DUF262
MVCPTAMQAPIEATEPIEQIVDDFIDEERTLTQDIKYQITTYGADFLVDGLVSRFKTEDIYVPDFQRSFVWTRPQASRFIESLLLGLPTPGIFLYRELETNKFLIVDGLQRLITLHSYLAAQLPGSDRIFRLERVAPAFLGRTFDDLDPEDQRQLLNTVIHATIFQQTDPPAAYDEKNSVYLVFERLNSGGTPLQPQEIRSALYHGAFVDLLASLNENEHWRRIYGPKSRRRKDDELILRHLAFLYDGSNYSSPMVRFLNKFMARNRTLKHLPASDVAEKFDATCRYIVKALHTRAFRPRRNLNAAVFDAVSVIVSAHSLYSKVPPAEFAARYDRLLQDDEFDEAVSKSTSDVAVVKKRFQKATEVLAE